MRPASLRERMEQHRSNPVCATCHSRMDPLGFALEHFDAVGRWREKDAGAEINAAISLSGQKIESSRAFRDALIAAQGDAFVRTVAEKLLTYALGRGLSYTDAPAVRQIVRDVSGNGYTWSSLVLAIVKSTPFQMRAAAAPARVVGAE